MDQIIRHLKNSRNVLVVSHTNPDGDAIGSLIATGLALETLNKKTTLYNESPIPAVYRFLPSVDRVVRRLNNSSYDTAVILDCGNLQRVGEGVSEIERTPVIINIDHHITNTFFGSFRLVDTSASATAEIVYRLIKQLSVPIDENIAISIYTGILTDTGSFRFSNTNKAAFAICAEMVAIGVDPYRVAQHVYGTYSLGRIKLLNLALDSIVISSNGKLSIMTLTQNMFNETRTQPEDVDGLINYAKRIEDVKVAALIQEHQDSGGESTSFSKYHVSLRSDGTVNVAEIAASFGGGGHSSAAGFNIESTLPDLKTKILNLAEKL
ncbi:MAG: bifunctional oligoribonuclease/PAP phosphatase NrnA [Desulfobacterales bacterium]|uniref:Bifunctional oligoribonuclease/PAP phosphatase NrnA n=1 Tax=Candidatus Desulfatibia profunda TaxID=2841695 RepID=A0A8J6TLK1_9BACT|nr:bifunctional oligoribonuclease/PAP phosphatase NrnA [Candidatus Desulfatibia profunda]MBL7179606.1 bifunctional oligoribonuclease/PAP phosphatase NrnA [Desulfobacterales bacterium]